MLKQTSVFIEKEHKLFINNQWLEPQAGKRFPAINPADASALSSIAQAEEADVNEAVQAARQAFEQSWSKFAPAKRTRLILALADLMERDIHILQELETLDNGKPLGKALYDIKGAINHFRYYAGWASKIEGSTIPVSSEDKLVYTRREALGVVGLIVPWNFPLMIASWKLAPALACGNCCLLKPAEQTSLTALYLAQLVIEAGFPPGVVNILTGPGLTGAAITAHMDVDKVSFTGSTKVGRLVMEAAAKSNLKKVSLELGGKSPNIIFNDADLDAVNKSVLWSSFYNSGQECTLGSRIYIHEQVHDQVLETLQQNASQLTLGHGINNPDLGPVISADQLYRIGGFISRGQEQAELVLGGKRAGGELENGYFIEPTIFSHKDDTIEIVQEEVFGPVVTVSSFYDYEEAIHRANQSNYGLASAVWTRDISKAHRFARDIKSGVVWINAYDLFDPAVPFGGYKQSGIGMEMGKSAIELFTQEKAIWVNL